MSSWSDREDAQAALARAVADRDAEATTELLAEKHGEAYARDVLDALRADLLRATGKAE